MTTDQPMTEEKMREEIQQLPGGDGWWHSSGEETFQQIADRLYARGIGRAEVVDLLAEAYGAAAGEFGG